MGVTQETRRAAHEGISGKAESRQRLVVNALSKSPDGMTAEELADHLLQNGAIRRFDMNYVRPRLTELKKVGKVICTGTRRSYRTGKQTAVWRVLNGGRDGSSS